ncbi:gag-pol polyprotein [Drepanopeziza brunnea f. sp. 'multigermtubi' MB_m1]|uniref:Gag-pol polyprotein n=1 Tax=Marssonina brunnea f. sp. multigermtubi (strain MB_m1) TaxID=1072389 RepID=K1WTF0_MARBU|nr:gag-pol polyprotein [Drepanopeziza brunnea f. sp. 'multigermtubi' MB_m1]EKD15697.1 gag-pol polyprotein [Drepanopeziza brunnea f. sp. 'multigermtubi' MB_m1]
MDKPEPAYTAILNRNASRSKDLRNLPVTLLKAFKAAPKLKAKPSKTAKSYEKLSKVISSLKIDYEATRIELLKRRDLLKNLTLDKTIAFFAALSTSKRSFSEATVSVAKASKDCLIINSKPIPKATDDLSLITDARAILDTNAEISVIIYDAAVKFEFIDVLAFTECDPLTTCQIDANSTLYRTRKEISSDSAKVFGMYKTKDKKIRPVDEADGIRAALSGKVDWYELSKAKDTLQEQVREYKQYLFPRIADIPKGFRITLERIANLDVGNTLRLKEKDLFKKIMLSKEKSIAFAWQEYGRFYDDVSLPIKLKTILHTA